ncbi:helix-turn-helix domain-containing protein [Phytohabitans sp. LJ34]|uniref:helix-turn-helix domain-containing protein n=1 Tax=Phytohabitans sp. LJ34 TaxID=3452217 RepID=UPI003F8A413E
MAEGVRRRGRADHPPTQVPPRGGSGRRPLILLDGLRAYFRHGSAAEAAAALGLHPQTMRHRLQRCGELSGRHLDDSSGPPGAGLHPRLTAHPPVITETHQIWSFTQRHAGYAHFP